MSDVLKIKIGKFYLGKGGIGDFLIFLSTFYDKSVNVNIIWFTNPEERDSIKDLAFSFSKIKNFLIFTKLEKWSEFSNSELCLGTGITPRNLDFSEWKNVEIFKKYGVTEFPSFRLEFKSKFENKDFVCVMAKGGRQSEEAIGKRKIFTDETIAKIISENEGKKVYLVGKDPEPRFPSEWDRSYLNKDIEDQMRLIESCSKMYSVDSWAKTWSAMCDIETIVFDSVYDENYLKSMGGVDWGHYVFLFPWSKIKLIKQ